MGALTNTLLATTVLTRPESATIPASDSGSQPETTFLNSWEGGNRCKPDDPSGGDTAEVPTTRPLPLKPAGKANSTLNTAMLIAVGSRRRSLNLPRGPLLTS